MVEVEGTTHNIWMTECPGEQTEISEMIESAEKNVENKYEPFNELTKEVDQTNIHFSENVIPKENSESELDFVHSTGDGKISPSLIMRFDKITKNLEEPAQ